MKRLQILLSLAFCFALFTPASAKSPKAPGVDRAPRALTPPPKEWAMFPDEPPAAPPPAATNPPPNQPGVPPSANQPGHATAPATGGIVSAPVLPAPKHDIPILWIAVTGLLSFGALIACGGLILKKEEPEAEVESGVKMVAGVPIVPDEQEIR